MTETYVTFTSDCGCWPERERWASIWASPDGSDPTTQELLFTTVESAVQD